MRRPAIGVGSASQSLGRVLRLSQSRLLTVVDGGCGFSINFVWVHLVGCLGWLGLACLLLASWFVGAGDVVYN